MIVILGKRFPTDPGNILLEVRALYRSKADKDDGGGWFHLQKVKKYQVFKEALMATYLFDDLYAAKKAAKVHPMKLAEILVVYAIRSKMDLDIQKEKGK